MNIELEKYPLPKSENQTYICTNDGEEYFMAGHIEVGKLANPELKASLELMPGLKSHLTMGRNLVITGLLTFTKSAQPKGGLDAG